MALILLVCRRLATNWTRADAIARCPFEVCTDVFAAVVKAARPGVRRKVRDAVRLIDAAKLHLSGAGSGWARFSDDLTAAKLHLVYDPVSELLLTAQITPGNVNGITPARALKAEPGATCVFDLACYDYGW